MSKTSIKHSTILQSLAVQKTNFMFFSSKKRSNSIKITTTKIDIFFFKEHQFDNTLKIINEYGVYLKFRYSIVYIVISIPIFLIWFINLESCELSHNKSFVNLFIDT